jgi:excisionase family DNA binding protein
MSETVSVTAAAQRLGISRISAYRAVARGDLPSIRIGGRILIPSGALDRLLNPQIGEGSAG